MCLRSSVAFSCSATMTISRKNNEELIYLASFNTEPEELVLETRSLPARSTRWSLERRTRSEPSSRSSMAMVKMQCEREDALPPPLHQYTALGDTEMMRTMFMGVSAMARLVSPWNSRSNASISVFASCMLKFFK